MYITALLNVQLHKRMSPKGMQWAYTGTVRWFQLAVSVVSGRCWISLQCLWKYKITCSAPHGILLVFQSVRGIFSGHGGRWRISCLPSACHLQCLGPSRFPAHSNDLIPVILLAFSSHIFLELFIIHLLSNNPYCMQHHIAYCQCLDLFASGWPSY